MRSHTPHPLVRALDEVIAGVEIAQMPETALLLRIARLDLAIRMHNIEAHEVELLSDALATGVHRPVVKKKSARKKAVKKSAKKATKSRRPH